MTIYVGTSGWSYAHWRGVFYPQGLLASRQIDFYAAHFPTVELNASFYHWPRETAFAHWRTLLPSGFQMSVKAPRGLTHGLRLREPSSWLARTATGLSALGDRFGVFLVQLPPDLERDLSLLSEFLTQVPAWIRVAIEMRHPSWQREDAFEILADRGAAYCITSGLDLPGTLRATTNFVYVRLHGPNDGLLYSGCYSDDSLRMWAQRICAWQDDRRDVYVYFNNDSAGYAVRNAKTLSNFLDLKWPPYEDRTR